MKLKDTMIKKINDVFSFKIKSKDKTLFYSANKSLLFFLLSIFLFMLLLGKSLDGVSSKIKNPYAAGVINAAVKPVSKLSQKLKLDNLIPSARILFLRYAGLEGLSDWDSFYYLENTGESIDSHIDEKSSIDKFTNDLERTIESLPHTDLHSEDTAAARKMVDELEAKLENINTVLDRLKDIEQARIAELEKIRLTQKMLELKKQDVSDTAADEEGANAEQADEPKKVYTYNAEKPLRILMIGDSQMQSIASGFLRLTGQNSSISVKEISVHSSGFIRSDYYNWPKKLKQVFEESKNEPYDIAVIFLGMNDYQNFYADNGKVLVKETENWESAYKDKIKTHLNILLENTKKVYWLGMPTVRNKIYNAQLLYIEDLHKKIASEYSEIILKKFSLSSVAPGDGVPYSDTVKTSDGKEIRLMKDDGNHYTISGGEYIMKPFLELLYRDWDVEPCK
ncbi:DUF459 domain-containing protein [Treponema putidum]|uniref:DUF459 domain-containing protein n=2 Tax=Treponema putidum TaxID=221027 RepID=A0AAE9MUR7_9SPIR|nr:DUF459 domain-containing protein [Treponema putidum]TWI77583.1 hypothetical protein JM98_01277 [Treponema putidum]UTY28731.1 DUF459 domain-containing protein [Treponema putidum]UTY31161.1 DUF459 domain-containing protein [Treponema putidum]UTY33598.1 DUF459 domain-containing protein [Treponema putidum]